MHKPFATFKSDEQEDSPDKLAIDRVTYALGESAKSGLIWGVVTSAAVFAVVGVSKAFKWNSVIKGLEWINNKPKELWELVQGLFSKSVAPATGGNFSKVSKFVKDTFDGPTTILSLGLGTIIGHMISLPGYRQGWRQAKVAIQQHDAIVNERDKLREENVSLHAKLEMSAHAPEKTFASDDLKKSSDLASTASLTHAERVAASAAAADGPALG